MRTRRRHHTIAHPRHAARRRPPDGARSPRRDPYRVPSPARPPSRARPRNPFVTHFVTRFVTHFVTHFPPGLAPPFVPRDRPRLPAPITAYGNHPTCGHLPLRATSASAPLRHTLFFFFDTATSPRDLRAPRSPIFPAFLTALHQLGPRRPSLPSSAHATQKKRVR